MYFNVFIPISAPVCYLTVTFPDHVKCAFRLSLRAAGWPQACFSLLKHPFVLTVPCGGKHINIPDFLLGGSQGMLSVQKRESHAGRESRVCVAQ